MLHGELINETRNKIWTKSRLLLFWLNKDDWCSVFAKSWSQFEQIVKGELYSNLKIINDRCESLNSEDKQRGAPVIQYPAECHEQSIPEDTWWVSDNYKGVPVINSDGWSVIAQRNQNASPGKANKIVFYLMDKNGEYHKIPYGHAHQAVYYPSWNVYAQRLAKVEVDKDLLYDKYDILYDFFRMLFTDDEFMLLSEEDSQFILQKITAFGEQIRELVIKNNRLLVAIDAIDDLNKDYKSLYEIIERTIRSHIYSTYSAVDIDYIVRLINEALQEFHSIGRTIGDRVTREKKVREKNDIIIKLINKLALFTEKAKSDKQESRLSRGGPMIV